MIRKHISKCRDRDTRKCISRCEDTTNIYKYPKKKVTVSLLFHKILLLIINWRLTILTFGGKREFSVTYSSFFIREIQVEGLTFHLVVFIEINFSWILLLLCMYLFFHIFLLLYINLTTRVHLRSISRLFDSVKLSLLESASSLVVIWCLIRTSVPEDHQKEMKGKHWKT